MSEVELVNFLGGVIAVHQRRDESEDGISILEHRVAEGFSPPRHLHHEEEEVFHILEGAISYVRGNETGLAKVGDTLRIPAATEHSFKVVSPGGARFLTMTRGAFEDMVRSVSAPADAQDRPSLHMPSEAEQRALAEACSLHGITLVGPPMA